MLQPKKVYIENCTIYGRVQCTHCGSHTDIFHVEMITQDLKDQWETTICKECLKDLPSVHEDMTEEEL